MDEWKQIWSKDERINKIILESLIKADGFDSGAGSFTVDDWLTYTNELYDELNISQYNSIYDIGCGSGAFLYPLYLKSHKKYMRLGGVDYSISLINFAKTIMPKGDFVCDDAINMGMNEKYDFVVSHSVFHYFQDLNYAKEVLINMIQKADKKIGIFDINDKSKEKKYHQVRMGSMGKEEYKKKYSGLDHTFYDKNWFEKIAEENNCNIKIFDQMFESYSNSKLRFNVILEKK